MKIGELHYKLRHMEDSQKMFTEALNFLLKFGAMATKTIARYKWWRRCVECPRAA